MTHALPPAADRHRFCHCNPIPAVDRLRLRSLLHAPTISFAPRAAALLILSMLLANLLPAFGAGPNLAGTWMITQDITLTITIAGESDTEHQTTSDIITLTQSGNTVSYYLDVPDPITGGTTRIQRVGTIQGNTVTFSGIAMMPVEGITYSKNSSIVVGTINGNRIDGIATIDVAFSGFDVTGTITGGGSVVMIKNTPLPSITGIYPASVMSGTTVSSFTVYGSNFAATSTLSFSGSGITVNSYSLRSSYQIVANITVAAGAQPGRRNVIVTNPDGQSAILYSGFTVASPCVAPSITLHPKSATLDPGAKVDLWVSATGTQPLKYQWYEGVQGNTARPVGTDSPQVASSSPSASTSYWVRVSNSCGQADSQVAIITVRTGRMWVGNGPEGGEIGGLAIDPQNPATVYAAAHGGGIFKSDTGGSSWRAINSGLPNRNAEAVAIDPWNPRTLYASVDPGGVYKSVDGGLSWREAKYGLTGTLIVDFAINPLNPAEIYAASISGGVFKTINGGTSWSAVNVGLTSTAVQTIAINPQSPTTVYTGTRKGGVFRSLNGGASWSAINSGLTDTVVEVVAIDPQNPATVYAGTTSGGVFKSTNGGDTWSATNSGLTNMSIRSLAIDPRNPATIYAGTTGVAYRSSDGGANWTAVTAGLTVSYIQALAVDPQNPATIYAGGMGAGICKTGNGGASWSLINKGLTAAVVLSLAVDPQNPATIYAGTLNAGVHKSVNSGAGWSAINTGLPYSYIRALAVDPQNPATVYAGTIHGGVFKSTNGGAGWSSANAGMPAVDICALAVDPQNPATLYAGSCSQGVFKSTTGGTSWTAAGTGLANTQVMALALDPQTPATLYAGTYAGGVFKTVDGGTSWNAVNNGLTSTSIQAMVVDPKNPATVYAGTYTSGVFKSANGGANWSAVNSGLTYALIGALAIDPQNPQTIYAGTYWNEGGVFKSINGGASWSPVVTGLASASVWTMAIDPECPTRIYAGTDGGGVFASSALAQVRLSMSARGAASASTLGPAEELVAGYATGTVKSGSAPYGTAVFSYSQNGVVVSEVGVPASPPTLSARLFVDTRTNVSTGSGIGTLNIVTGFAAVNPNSKTANLSLKLRDGNGATLAQGSIRLAPGEHMAKFLDQLAPDFRLPSGFINNGLGSLEIAGDQPVSVLALRLTTNQRGDLLLTSTPVADLSRPPSTGTLSFPQIVDGGGYQTTFTLMNTSNAAETGTLRFYANDGSPLTVRMAGGGQAGSGFPYSIPAGGFLRLVSDGTPSGVNVGWAQLTSDQGTTAPVSAAIFSYTQAGMLVTESGVPAVTPTTHARIYVDKSGGHDTGLAVANPGGSSVRITAVAYQADGATRAGTGPATVNLAPMGHDARFAGQLVTGLAEGFTGILDLSSSAPFTALTLRSLMNARGDFLVTTFPIADAGTAPPSPLIFPQIADGGGYQTQIILLSTSGAPSAVTVSFQGNDGAPIGVGRAQ